MLARAKAMNCSICSGKADEEFRRVEVWANERWRLTMSTYRAVKGFCYLEPRRHVPYITDLEGKEAAEFGAVLSRAARAVRAATGAELVYVYIYGGHIPHLHVHLAPHKDGDPYVEDVLRSDAKISEELLGTKESQSLSRAIGRQMTTGSDVTRG